MAKRRDLNPLLENTEMGPDSDSEPSTDASDAGDQDSARGVDALADNLAGNINVLETKTDFTKSAILRSIEEIRTQIEDERAISDALRKDLEKAQNALNEKESDTQRLQAELASSMTKAGIIEGLKDEISFMTKELKTAQGQVDRQKDDLMEKDKSINELQTKIIAVEEERSRMLQEMKTEMGNFMRMQKDLAEITKEKEEAVREKNNLAVKYKSLEADFNRLREESKALDEIQQALSDTRRSTRK